ncbi:MAG: AAA family ATPase [Oscillospiraceae bacterium]|nr:AAA family ATPase [Oscillospiraceae bacterium]
MKLYENIPAELKSAGYFCVWRYEYRPGKEKPDKVPYHPMTGKPVKVNDRSTFADFKSAHLSAIPHDGIGVGVFDDFVAVDIDNCVENNVVNEFAQKIIGIMDSYAEISPSGNGARIFCKAKDFNYDKSRYYINNQSLGLEVYVGSQTSRFVTITDNVIHKGKFGERTVQLAEVLDRYMRRPELPDMADIESCSCLTDDEVIRKAMSAKNSEAFDKLWHGDISDYPSPSEADMALAGKLAFWCGRDLEQMERLMSQSALGKRDKWEREDYRHNTLITAIGNCREVYAPDYGKISAADDFADNVVHTRSLVRPATSVITKAVPWLIEGLFIRGAMTSIQGLPDSGKSFLTCALAVAIANGGFFPKADGAMMQLNPGRVLFANFDDALEFGVKPRLEKLGLSNEGAERTFFLDPETAAGITFEDKRLAAVFEECKPDLAIFDTLQHFIGGNVDLHRANETNAAMLQLKLLAEKYNTAVVIVQHISKNAAGGSGGASVLWGLGSTAINGLFRSVWTVGKVKGVDETLRAAVSSKNNLLPYVPPALQYSLSQTEGFKWRGINQELSARDLIRGDSDTGSRGRPADKRNRAEIFLEDILSSGKVRAADIFRSGSREGLSERTIKRAKSNLGTVKTFQQGREWFWELSEDHNECANIP